MGINLVLFLGVLPSLAHTQQLNRKEYQRFRDACLYMEQMLYAFKKCPKILTALEEVSGFFPEGQMHERLLDARFYLRKGQGKEDIFQETLQIIQEDYRNSRMERVHRYLARVENYGGEYEASLDLLMDDLNLFTNRIFQLQKEKKGIKNRIWMAFFISLFICGIGAQLLPKGYSIGNNPIVESATLLMVGINLMALAKASRKLTTNWLNREKMKNERQLERYYQKAVSGKRHSIGVKIAFYKVKSEIERVFPEWMMELALYLRNGNVQRAIEQSAKTAPGVIKQPLQELSEELGRHPNGIAPYLGFLKEFELPQVQSAMKMLYGIAETGGSDHQGQKQIEGLIKQNTTLMNHSEQLRNEDALAGMSLLTLFPMITGSVKLMLDMVMFIILFMRNLKL
ncbi:MAG: hypothetical protein RR364_03380 [Lachnospiraceae bacterium]